MKTRAELILEQAPAVGLDKVHALLGRFIPHAVVKEKRRRWLELAMKPGKFHSGFTDFGNSLDFTKASELRFLELPDREYIYYRKGGHGHLLTAQEAMDACDAEDGLLFNERGGLVYFLTHESQYHVYRLPAGA